MWIEESSVHTLSGNFHENSSLKGIIAHLPHGKRGDSTRQLEYTGVYTSHKDLQDIRRWLHSAHFIWEKYYSITLWRGKMQHSE